MSKPAPNKAHTRIKLNLLYPQGTPQKIPIRFLKWLISYGRFIIVVVEILVLGCFAFRFKLDADLADLKERIDNHIPYLESQVVDEALINQTQLRLSAIQKTYAASSVYPDVVKELAKQIPQEVKMSVLNIDESKTASNTINFRISAETTSHNMLSVFIAGLRSSTKFKEANLTSINFDQGLIVFTISGSTK